MPDKSFNTTMTAQQVKFAIRQLDSLSILPCVAAGLFPKLLELQFSPSALADIIELDPALTVKLLSLMHQQGLTWPDERFSLRVALDKISNDIVRDTFLSVNVLEGFGPDDDRSLFRKELSFHGLAVACCAKDIAEIAPDQIDSQLAFSAGLLHDIGKLGLEEAMPKSFARIVEEAKSTKASARFIEQKHLGADHTIFGKRLAQKWHLPSEITFAIWLHHSSADAISENIVESRMAQVVQLADSIARQCSIGQSGSYDSPQPVEKTAELLGIGAQQLQQIKGELPEKVGKKSKVLGLDLPNAAASYCGVIHGAATQLAREHAKLSRENRQLQTTSSHFDFVREFLLGIDSSSGAIEVAEKFAIGWQKFYQTGMVCLYLAPMVKSQSLEAVVVENLSQSKTIILDAPAEVPAIPKVIARNFAILNAHDHVDWLFEQLDIEFDPNQTKLVPLLSNGKAVGAIVFEVRYPGDVELFSEKFRLTASLAGAVLDMAIRRQRQEDFAEQFVQLLSRPSDIKPQIAARDPLKAITEMAAGAAHELNNPLSVISGRAELLAGAEADPAKKRILEQIKDNTNEISEIINDLLSYAEPQPAKPALVDVKQMLDEAIELTCRKTKVEYINTQIEVVEDVKTVFVDSAQIVSAIANVLSNAVESYAGSLGPVKVTAISEGSGGFAKLQISDLGCGMDTETVQKATQPFFSAKPAGRKRGMGLAYAQRLIELNRGALEITSEPGKGTTVTISLPCK